MRASVRGIGVAVMTSMCGPPFSPEEGGSLPHTETVLFVDNDETEVLELDRFLDERVRADDDRRRPAGDLARGSGVSRAA